MHDHYVLAHTRSRLAELLAEAEHERLATAVPSARAGRHGGSRLRDALRRTAPVRAPGTCCA